VENQVCTFDVLTWRIMLIFIVTVESVLSMWVFDLLSFKDTY